MLERKANVYEFHVYISSRRPFKCLSIGLLVTTLLHKPQWWLLSYTILKPEQQDYVHLRKDCLRSRIATVCLEDREYHRVEVHHRTGPPSRFREWVGLIVFAWSRSIVTVAKYQDIKVHYLLAHPVLRGEVGSPPGKTTPFCRDKNVLY